MVKGKAQRKPHGQGKLALQRQRRYHISDVLCEQLLQKMNMEAIEATGVLFPKSSGMKKQKHKSKFSFLGGFGGRVFTKKMCILTCRKLIHSLPFRLNFDPRMTQEAFVEAQAGRLKALAKKVKRVANDMDQADTQPLVGAPFQDRKLHAWKSFFANLIFTMFSF